MNPGVEFLFFLLIAAQAAIPVAFIMTTGDLWKICRKPFVGSAILGATVILMWLAPHPVFRLLALGMAAPLLTEALNKQLDRLQAN